MATDQLRDKLDQAADRADAASTAFYAVLTNNKETPVPVEGGTVESMSKRIYDQVGAQIDAINEKADEAADSAASANASKDAAANSATQANSANTAAEGARDTAVQAKEQAQTAAQASQASTVSAQSSASNSSNFANQAANSANTASTAANQSVQAKDAANVAKNAAQASEASAESSKNAAGTSASNSASSEAAAKGYSEAALAYRDSSLTNANSAAASATQSATSAAAALTSAQEAKTAATSAASANTSAQSSKDAAATSAASASQSATNAASSATVAGQKETGAISAANSAEAYKTQAQSASTSAQGFAAQAEASATEASGYLDDVEQSASNASASATSAQDSKDAAALSATAAQSSATSAASSANSASVSANSAQQILADIQTTSVTKTSQTGSAFMPSGTTAQRNSSQGDGSSRVNTETGLFEYFLSGAWKGIKGLGEFGLTAKNLGDYEFDSISESGLYSIRASVNRPVSTLSYYTVLHIAARFGSTSTGSVQIVAPGFLSEGLPVYLFARISRESTWTPWATIVQSENVATYVKTSLNASGSAPVYACRAWARINGGSTPSVVANGNISSVTRSSAGVYRANFLTAMPNANYDASVDCGAKLSTNTKASITVNDSGVPVDYTTTGFQFHCGDSTGQADSAFITLRVFA